MPKSKFLLICFRDIVSWWRQDEKDEFVLLNHVGGYINKLSIDDVLDSVEVDSFSELDWTKTSYISESIPTGWVDRDGKYFGFTGAFNDSLTFLYFRLDTDEMDNLGWVRVYGDGTYYSKYAINIMQKDTLIKRGCVFHHID